MRVTERVYAKQILRREHFHVLVTTPTCARTRVPVFSVQTRRCWRAFRRIIMYLLDH